MINKERIIHSCPQRSNIETELCEVLDYSREEERIKSFKSWEVHYPVDPNRLAKAGFYYIGNEDEVVCFSCHGHIKNWNFGDVVFKKHSDLFPNCDFVNNRSNNVPIIHSNKPQSNFENKQKKIVPTQSTILSQKINAVDYDKMKLVQERIETFSANWPLPNMDVRKIAEAGFFYLGIKDKVQCPFCKGILSNWEIGDDPLTEHNNHFPLCDYISSFVADARLKKAIQIHSEDLCGNMKKSINSSMSNNVKENQEQMCLEKLGIHMHGNPANPQQACYDSRLRSFSAWPNTAPVSKEDLAKAGFFSIGIGDFVKCFHCNGGLQSWEPGDDPWIEHARWFGHCDFVRLNKGEDFISLQTHQHPSMQYKPDNLQHSLLDLSSKLLMDKVDEAMESSIVKQVLETEVFQSCIIRATILCQIKETGSSFSTTDELCIAASCLKDEMRNEPSKMNNYKASDLNVVLRKCTIGSDHNSDNVECAETALKQPALVLPKLSRKLEVVETSLSTDRCLCKICMDKEVSVVFLPCSHLLACTECAPALKSCPMCRQTIQAIVKAYLP
ncbi:baculoviral IAP repeat-containing protein 3 [Nephila pilipes]|uniref:Baculoviral IAP repeat-containing protein 3 n=1 Tax=Nephila pilipes TaxID=299642 RepID=A0A8X6TFD1_NEPPI|nr:baculoviral IAP repeat-containing protein 3 [Nephila pilipes]